ncbi:shikimate kinase [Phenylobacterium montanum]|uniref:Shikimate kinase n=1 Tax=Phenylobacterium montanum TaxID=2823693 RepID=A0A975FXA7_9CAUL|nr:shikimate kinase [Caulobacter sp. S6]QUD87178.1 shikimate kinase [Caulobacter sp. S6]
MTVEPALRRHTIVLVGLMGAGKTSVGRRLAGALGLPFRDADEEVEKAAGRSVSDIFAELGEPAFRAGERRVIARLLQDPPHVLATGGGAFMNDETRALIKDKAISVWLKADIDVLVERVGRKNDRPLLQGKDPAETLRELAALRHPVYALADITVESIESPHSTTVNAIIEALRTRLAAEGASP